MTPPADEPDPVMVRRYAGGHSGPTAFFRNRPFLRTLLAILAEGDPNVSRVLVHACSIGAEPYSLALWWLHHPWPSAPRRIEIVAADIEREFLDVARGGVYPAAVLDGMTEEERAWFDPHPEGVRVPYDARALVRFLPPMSFVDADPGGVFDAVLIMNALAYLTAEEQQRAIRRVARYARVALGLTAFHPDTIQADVTEAGFRPVEQNHLEIHNCWGDRLTTGEIVPGSPDYSWRLPPYSTQPSDFSYRYCSIFTRTGR
jgi:chemotaxis methyl-accepting protein methylase